MSNDYWGRPAEDPGQDAASSDENGQASPETAGQANQEQTGSAAPTYGSPAYEQTAGEQPSTEPAAPSAYGQPDTPSTPPTQAGYGQSSYEQPGGYGQQSGPQPTTPSYGQPGVTFDPTSKGASAFVAFARENGKALIVDSAVAMFGIDRRKPGRDGGFSWEKTDLVDALKKAVA